MKSLEGVKIIQETRGREKDRERERDGWRETVKEGGGDSAVCAGV